MEPDDIERFMAEGFIKLEGAVPLQVIDECRAILWRELGLDPDDPTTWTEPVRWVMGLVQPSFKAAMNVPPLLEACEALSGPGRWTPRDNMGAFPLRFPHDEEPPGLGWHVEGSFMPEGATFYWTNLASKDRAMLALYLFTDIEEEDGPTRIRVGSHHDVPAVLLPFGEKGAAGNQLGPLVDAASAHRLEVHATGQAGDIYLCHPFLIHAAQANHGTRPRFIGQPAILPLNPYRYDLPDQESSPVELTIKRALNQARWPVP